MCVSPSYIDSRCTTFTSIVSGGKTESYLPSYLCVTQASDAIHYLPTTQLLTGTMVIGWSLLWITFSQHTDLGVMEGFLGGM
jgi:hypothetical protein